MVAVSAVQQECWEAEVCPRLLPLCALVQAASQAGARRTPWTFDGLKGREGKGGSSWDSTREGSKALQQIGGGCGDRVSHRGAVIMKICS